MSLHSGVTAYSGGGNSSAVLVTATFCQISTCAAEFDSVALPNDIRGPITVRNDGAKTAHVFPPVGVAAQINGLGANNGYPLPAGGVQEFMKVSATLWYTLRTGMFYVNRGDPAGPDLEEGSMTMDGNYIDWDISSVVGAGAKLVKIRVTFADDADNIVKFKIPDQSNTKNIATTRVVAGEANDDTVECQTNATGILEYAVGSTGTQVEFTVRGWWEVL